LIKGMTETEFNQPVGFLRHIARVFIEEEKQRALREYRDKKEGDD